MIINGRQIAKEILDEVGKGVTDASRPPRLAIVTVAPDFATRNYLTYKQVAAKKVGIATTLLELPQNTTTDDVIALVAQTTTTADGIVVQLPLPAHIDTDKVIAHIPLSHDVDGFHYDGEETDILPPVVGAIDVISRQQGLSWKDKRVVILGAGRLVGIPAMLYARRHTAQVKTITEDTPHPEEYLKMADIIVSGVGKAGIIGQRSVRAGTAVFDAGTSEDGGQLKGDAVPAIGKTAALFTPVPGGIGPLTIAILLQNTLSLAQQKCYATAHSNI